jgi:prepilin-type N-terminal cleavage/methylation domain-containing protein
MKDKHVSLNKGYTLVEIMIALAILLIIATIATSFYFKFLDKARESVCETHLKGLHKAVQLYGIENHALPATLGQLKHQYLKQGYDLAMEQRSWKTKLAQSFLESSLTAEAHAFSLTYENFKNYATNEKMFQCPADHNGGASYALNAEIAGKNLDEIGSDVVLIAESDSYTFSDANDLKYRHGKGNRALAVTVDGRIIKLDRTDKADGGGIGDVGNGEDDSGNEDDDDEVTICHMGKTTKTKSGADLDAHLGHGDTLGPCPDD